MNARILVIDDEEALCEILKFNLEKAGYDVDCAYSAEEALEKDLTVYNLIIADIMMESLSGFDFAKRVRNNPATEFIPIIFCSARPEADDNSYVSDIKFEGLSIDRNEKLCYMDGKELNLTRTEYDILLFFLTHRNRIYSREELIEKIWDSNVVVTTRTIDTNIARLRKKIGEYGNNIVTRLGFGYGFKEKI